MFSGKLFLISITISVIGHGVILSQNPDIRLIATQEKSNVIEVHYLKKAQESKSEIKTTASKKEPFLKLSRNTTADKIIPPPYMENLRERPIKDSPEFNKHTPEFAKPAFVKSDYLSSKKKITLPLISLDKISSPSYSNYYQFLREKIKRAAYQNYNSSEVGEITLSFVVSRDGYLRNLQFSDDNTSNSAYLKEIAWRSLKEASPFPSFPKDLDYQQLPFKLTIIFELD